MDVKSKIVCNHIVGTPAEYFDITTCPRCRGRGWYGDISFNTNGQFDFITNLTALDQRIEKILIENVRTSGYGLNQLILRGVINVDSVSNIDYEIIRVMKYLKRLQDLNLASGFFYNVTEQIQSIGNISVTQDPNEPRKINIYMDIATVSGNSKVKIIRGI